MMIAILVVLALAIAGGATFFLMKSGKIEDKDNNNIPDVVEKKIEDVKEVVKEVKQVVEKVTKPATKKPAAKKTAKKSTKK